MPEADLQLAEFEHLPRMSFHKPAPGCTPYQYQTLPNGSIRLITLFQGETRMPLAATLNVVPLVGGHQPRQLKTPYYEALSYTWGTPFIEDHLYIDQKYYLSIGANLSAALRRLRRTDRPRTLWVDALSIHQKDPVERAQQVSVMKDVYSGADKVIIFIGLEEHRSDEAMACVADVDGDLSAQNRQAVNSLLRRPWFSRVWVVQVVARSRSAVVVCGSKAVSWDCFWRLPFRCRQSGWSDFSSTEGLPGILNYSSGHPPVSGSEGLLHLLHENRGAGATDLRDKIFGILGLMDNASPYLKLIDYTSPVDSVYSLVAHQVIQDSGSLQILSAAGHGYLDVFNRSIRGLGVPSWVPDWSIVMIVALLGGPVPYVLRPTPHKNDMPRFELIGECYVYGVMHGEAFHHVRTKAEELGGILPPTSSGPCKEQLRWFSIQ